MKIVWYGAKRGIKMVHSMLIDLGKKIPYMDKKFIKQKLNFVKKITEKR